MIVIFSDHTDRLVVIFQQTARNHFWETGFLMQSYNTWPVCTPENGFYANYRGQRSLSAFLHLKHINVMNTPDDILQALLSAPVWGKEEINDLVSNRLMQIPTKFDDSIKQNGPVLFLQYTK